MRRYKQIKKLRIYSVHIRRKILSIKENESLSFVKIGRRCRISANTISQWTKRLKSKIKREKDQ